MKFFVDSNVLLYGIDPDESAKRAIARNILSRGQPGDMALSTQVLGEFMSVVRRRHLTSLDQALAMVERWSLLVPTTPTLPDHLVAGTRISLRYKLQFWDSVILAVAIAEGGTTFLSEDMQDGMTIDGLTIMNPFLPANSARLEALLLAE